jgi:rubredoxin-NAD+ reductase
MQSIVIIGSGIAGYSVAREVRKRDKSARLVVVTADDGHFYSKPALSEAFRLGAPVAELSARSAQGMAAQIRGEVWTDARVERIDLAGRTIDTSKGPLAYDKLVLSLGAEPVRLPLDATSLAHVFTVNDLCDYRRFRHAAEGTKVVAILGAGLIGCEFANDLLDAGFEVRVIDIASAPLNRLLPGPNGRYMHDALQQAGVDWHLGTGVQAIEGAGQGVRIHCTSGESFDADIVLSAIGLRPRTALAREAGLEVAHGITVDAALRTSDPNVHALGDCAEVHGLWLPYIAPIGPAAKVIAANLTGDAALVRYGAMPVIVKTPACPAVVCPPPAGVLGEWNTESDPAGMQSLFRDAGGLLRGFALNGAHTERASALAQTMPMLLA